MLLFHRTCTRKLISPPPSTDLLLLNGVPLNHSSPLKVPHLLHWPLLNGIVRWLRSVILAYRPNSSILTSKEKASADLLSTLLREP